MGLIPGKNPVHHCDPRELEGKRGKLKLSSYNLLVINMNSKVKYSSKKSPFMLVLGERARIGHCQQFSMKRWLVLMSC